MVDLDFMTSEHLQSLFVKINYSNAVYLFWLHSNSKNKCCNILKYVSLCVNVFV
jgi:hypothetical protein